MNVEQSPPPPKPIKTSWPEDLTIPEQEWRVKGVLPMKGLAAIYGTSGVGKSFTALLMAYGIAAGDDVLGRRTTKAGVAYLAVEAPAGVKKRILAIRKHRGDDSKNVPLALVEMAVDFAKAETSDVDQLADRLRSDFETRGQPLGVVIVDTLASATPGMDESASRDMGITLQNLKRLAQQLDVLVIVVHHTGKDEDRGMRGHSSLYADLDAVLKLSGNAPSRHLLAEKVKDGEAKATWNVELRPVTLGQDEDGDDITSCVAIVSETDRGLEAKMRLSADEKFVLRALVALGSDGAGQVNRPGCSAPVGVPVFDRGQVRDKAISLGIRREGGANPMAATRKAWNRAASNLIINRLLGNQDDWLWLTDFGQSQIDGGTF